MTSEYSHHLSTRFPNRTLTSILAYYITLIVVICLTTRFSNTTAIKATLTPYQDNDRGLIIRFIT